MILAVVVELDERLGEAAGSGAAQLDAVGPGVEVGGVEQSPGEVEIALLLVAEEKVEHGALVDLQAEVEAALGRVVVAGDQAAVAVLVVAALTRVDEQVEAPALAARPDAAEGIGGLRVVAVADAAATVELEIAGSENRVDTSAR